MSVTRGSAEMYANIGQIRGTQADGSGAAVPDRAYGELEADDLLGGSAPGSPSTMSSRSENAIR